MELEPHKELITELITDLKYTYKQVQTVLHAEFGLVSGTSPRSIREFCYLHDIQRTCHRTPQAELGASVSAEYDLAGRQCGRKNLHGRLQSQGVPVGQNTVGRILKNLNPRDNADRTAGCIGQFNPPVYQADYHGQKVHLDQNEKLALYGVTHVIAVDGYSRKVLANSTMPVKNNLIIYEEVFRPIVMEYGVWDQLIIDKGKEFNLTAFAQEKYGAFRHDQTRISVKKGKSTENHPVERAWPDVNRFVNYPVKAVLNDMKHHDIIDITDEYDRYIVSEVSQDLIIPNLDRWAKGWNHHHIPGKGVPHLTARENGYGAGRRPRIPGHVMHAEDMARTYENELGGNLRRESPFADDPFPTDAACDNWWRRLRQEYPSTDPVWTAAVHGRPEILKEYYVFAFNQADAVLDIH